MSSILKPVLTLSGALVIGISAGFFWNPRTGLIVFFTTLIGICLGFLFSSYSGSTTPQINPPPHQTEPQDREVAANNNIAPASALFEATMDGMREGVLVIDDAMRVVTSNSAGRAIFNLHESESHPTRLSELTRNPGIYNAFRTALDRGERMEVKVELAGDDRRIFDLRVAPLRLVEDPELRGAIGVFFDITKLEHLERVRQEFLSNVSHELRTPLTSILAFVETLEAGAMEDRENNRRFLSVIRKNAARMGNLVDDILELSAIEAGTVTVTIDKVRLRTVVADIISALSARAKERSVIVRNEVAADVIVRADARRLEQMLTNLIDNAIKFNRVGGTVSISYEKCQRDRIVVMDTGDGITSEHIQRIFERFYRVDRSRSPLAGGTGLGLAIVKHLARAHGGEVSVQSIPGEGSRFIIELPTSEQSVNDAA